jgi:tRNA(Arg) A34 adenosine deaminase TadA
MSKKLHSKYLQYCTDKRMVKEVPLPYLNWMESELEAHMDFRDTIEPCSICAGYMLKRDIKGD